MERTLILLKPDALQRRLVGRIINRFEAKGLKIAAMRLVQVSPDLARSMYAMHEGKEFYAPLVTFMTASPVVAMVLEGNNAVSICRSMMGPTFGPDAPGGTIRGDFGVSKRYNLIHGSDSPASAAREIPMFFPPGEILQYEIAGDSWVYAQWQDQKI